MAAIEASAPPINWNRARRRPFKLRLDAGLSDGSLSDPGLSNGSLSDADLSGRSLETSEFVTVASPQEPHARIEKTSRFSRHRVVNNAD